VGKEFAEELCSCSPTGKGWETGVICNFSATNSDENKVEAGEFCRFQYKKVTTFIVLLCLLIYSPKGMNVQDFVFEAMQCPGTAAPSGCLPGSTPSGDVQFNRQRSEMTAARSKTSS